MDLCTELDYNCIKLDRADITKIQDCGFIGKNIELMVPTLVHSVERKAKIDPKEC
jgi:hypothetical protein